MSSSESGAQLKKLEAERSRLAEELAELQAAIPTAQAVDDLAAFVARTPEPMAVGGGGAVGGGAGADAAAGRATAPAVQEVKNPWMEPPVVEATCDCGAVWARIRGGGGGGGGAGAASAGTAAASAPRRPLCAPLSVTGCPSPPCCSVS